MNIEQQLTPGVLQQMIDKEFEEEFMSNKNHYDKFKDNPRPVKVQNDLFKEVFTHPAITHSLKKEQAKMLKEQAAKCYPAKHMSDDFPNYQQI